MTDDFRILHPAEWAEPRGYSDGISVPASGRYVALAGQIGWDPATCTFETDSFSGQVRKALENIVTLLREAEAEPRHLVRLTWFVTRRSEYANARKELGVIYREVIGTYYPPMSVVIVSGLVEERAKVEIEATAIVPA